MIKKILIAALIALPMSISAQVLKFGTVNTQDVFSVMPDKTEAEAKLDEVTKKYENEFKTLQDEFQKKYTEFQSVTQDASTPESIKDLRTREIQDLNLKIQNFREMASQDIQKQQETLMAPITAKIQDAITSVGKENGFTMIFDATIPSVVYVGETATDVTPLVKKKLGLK